MNPLLLEYSNEKVTDLHQPARTFQRRRVSFSSNRVTALVTVSLSNLLETNRGLVTQPRTLRRKRGRASYEIVNRRRGEAASPEDRIGRGNDRNAATRFFARSVFSLRFLFFSFFLNQILQTKEDGWMINGDSRRGISDFSPDGF